ncbi:flavin reductase family protein [Kitasatospora sp. NPDC059571]|uniref:flavin reductase family protein n=1 Tax=Kitasatospora sp. NPDC059571 TaxID=3346871 RepID=UPI0036BFBF0A
MTATLLAPARSVEPAEFRAAMASLAAPVTVVTCYDEEGVARGLTASAVASLSLDPPLFLVCLDRRSSTHDVLVSAPSFAVHLLGPGNEELALRFAGPAEARFAGRPVTGDAAPLLPEAPLTLVCARYGVRDGGDHSILIGRVTGIEGADRPSATGLLWHQRGFARAVPGPARPASGPAAARPAHPSAPTRSA